MKYKVVIDKDFIDIVPDYLSRRQDDLNSINKLLQEENYEDIKRIGHKMAGSGAGYGFDFISIKGKELEEMASVKSKDKILKIISELKDYLDNLEIVYE